jgi:MraZ protein
MSMFFGTHENKVDKKGRVSVPATFRAAIGMQNVPGIIIFPSWNAPGAYEGCRGDFLETLSSTMESMELFSEQDVMADLVFGAAVQLQWDAEGRIVLPEKVIKRIGLTDSVAFVGRGLTFQLWEPNRFYAEEEERLQRARELKLTLRLKPPVVA